jgi:DNA-binding MarR family transcriptional regulator
MLKIEILEKYTRIQILLYLLRNPEGRRKVDLRRDLEISSSTQIQGLDALLQANLVEPNDKSSETIFFLTPQGKVLAEKLLEIEAFMKTIIPRDPSINNIEKKNQKKDEDL